ncbi:pentapeptide repeat-containing protein [Nocardiopsis aegyptia]|uniref:Uncharacterized protein YjbI with pentapeptide repeats n=1 Tax=Nocardiopsis aegyptia TaxID=220378 RepID=A0A7Z0EIQ2_9ACTN|nr:pentapeptide repeat-containing protein [Nocardiopsis aegyptia]NYJ32825.1 uncharacterized protein YjbI with pentapeptide repeats [Nocardiopsis aegyptia]
MAHTPAWFSRLHTRLVRSRPEFGDAPRRTLVAVLAVGWLIVLGIGAWPLPSFLWELLPDRSRDLLSQAPITRAAIATLALAGLLATAVAGRRWKLWPTGLGWRILGAWATAVLLVALIVAALWLVLGLPGLDTTPTVSPKALDAIATRAFAIVAGLGGVALLVIAYQRQSGEQTRLFTERFTTAVAQLGEDQPAVRLGGVHALAHLADDAPTPGLRQMCVDVLCAYLRNPGPDELPQGSTDDQQQAHHGRVVEHAAMREVRLTIVRTISQHLRTPTPWRDCHYDFTGVVFEHHVNLTGAVCRGQVVLSQATFTRGAYFRDVTFAGDARFHHTTFTGHASFLGATFTGHANFRGATFTGRANFRGATFTGHASFLGATFTGRANFRGVTFTGDANFTRATFTSYTDFQDVTFTGRANFRSATFTSYTDFTGVTFTGHANFMGATFSRDVDFRGATFCRYADFEGKTARDTARGVCPRGLLTLAQTSEGEVRLPRRWSHPGRVRLKDPPPQKPEGAA